MACKWTYKGQDFSSESSVRTYLGIEPNLPPLKKGDVRLFRAQDGPLDGPIPDWVLSQPGFKASMEATGRWFYKTFDEAYQHLQTFESGGNFYYLDVPESEVEKYNARDNPFAGGYGKEGKEYFLPSDIAKRKKIVFSESGEQQQKFIERWNLQRVKRGPNWGYVPKNGRATRKLAVAIQERLKKVGGIYANITPVYDATYGLIMFKDSTGKMMQLPGTEGSKASPSTISKVKAYLQRIGVSTRELPSTEESMADILANLITVAEGKTDVALTEEAMHFAVEILEQTNPTLFNKLLNRVSNYKLYHSVVDAYGEHPLYRKDGKPNIRKLKKEAMGKILAEYVIASEEGKTEKPELIQEIRTFWQQILDFFKGRFRQAPNPFEEAVPVIFSNAETLEKRTGEIMDRVKAAPLRGVIRDLADEASESGNHVEFLNFFYDQLVDPDSYSAAVDSLGGDRQLAEDIMELFDENRYLQTAPQRDIYDKIEAVHKTITRVNTVPEEGDPTADEEESNNWYEIEGRRVANRVTDRVKKWYKSRFGNKKQPDFLKKLYKVYRETGVAAHADMEDIFHRYIDDQGFVRARHLPQTQPSKINPQNNQPYDALEDYFKGLLSTFPSGTRFRAESIIYNQGRDEAGSIDFLYILPESHENKVGILDWKFMSIKDGNKDVPWFKQESFNLQLKTYRQILQDKYGVTEFDKVRAIPFLFNFTSLPDGTLQLKGITTGSVDPRDEKDMRLVPVSTTEELTGVKEIDSLLTKLFAIRKKIENTPVKEGRKDYKAEQLNALIHTIRQLQTRQNLEPLAEQVLTLMDSIDRTIQKYNQFFKDKKYSDFTHEQINDFAGELISAMQFVDVYSNIDIELSNLIQGEEFNEIRENLTRAARDSRDHSFKLKGIVKDFADEYIGHRFNVTDILKPERVVQFLSKKFRVLSDSETTATRVLWNMVDGKNQRLQIETDAFNNRLAGLKKEYDTWAKGKGYTARNMYDVLFKKDKGGRRQHELIDEIDPDFFVQAEKARQAGKIQFFKDNIDLVAYQKEADRRIAEGIQRIDDEVLLGTPEEVNKKKQARKKELRDKFDITDSESLGWGSGLMNRYVLKDKWYSKEFKALKENKPALDFFNLIREVNDRATEAGYLSGYVTRTFVPFIRNSWMESISMGGSTKMMSQLVASMTVSESEVGYGQKDPFTGEIMNTIPKYFTEDLGTDVLDEKGNIVGRDYSQTSVDMFKVMSLYAEQVAKYEAYTELESSASILLNIERNKGSLQTTSGGDLIRLNGDPQFSAENEVNARLLENFIKATLYGQQFTADDNVDQTFGKWSNNFAKKINGKAGVKILPEDMEDRKFSLVKTIDTTNRAFQLKVLGVNLGTALTTFLGGQFQAIVNAGRFMSTRDLFSAELQLSMAKFNGEEGQKAFALLNYFLPFSELKQREQVQALGTTPFTRNSFSDIIMTLQRNADKFIQYMVALAYLKNSVIIDGQVVNAREYLRNQDDFKNRAKLPYAQRRAMEKSFPARVKELVEKKGLMKLVQMKDGQAILPGIERTSETVLNNRSYMQLLAQKATSNVSQDNMNQIRMNIIGRSFMVFKNWIPGLAFTRFGKLKKNEGLDQWEWGRTRMVYKIIAQDWIHSLSNLKHMLSGTDKGMDLIRQLYMKKAEKYREETGRDLTAELSEEEFMELVRQNIHSQFKDVMFYTTLLGMFIAAKAMPPDDDEDKRVKGAYKFSLRMIDKIKDEMAFFYSPISFQQILNGSVFPSLGLVTDAYRVATNVSLELFGYVVQDDELIESQQPIKYLMRTFPVSKELLHYLAIAFPDMAQEMDIQLRTESRIR